MKKLLGLELRKNTRRTIKTQESSGERVERERVDFVTVARSGVLSNILEDLQPDCFPRGKVKTV